jgi:ferredoxin
MERTHSTERRVQARDAARAVEECPVLAIALRRAEGKR